MSISNCPLGLFVYFIPYSCMHVTQRAPYMCRRKHLFLPVTELLIRPVVFSVALFRVFPTVLEASRAVQVYFPNLTPYLHVGGWGVGGGEGGSQRG